MSGFRTREGQVEWIFGRSRRMPTISRYRAQIVPSRLVKECYLQTSSMTLFTGDDKFELVRPFHRPAALKCLG